MEVVEVWTKHLCNIQQANQVIVPGWGMKRGQSYTPKLGEVQNVVKQL